MADADTSRGLVLNHDFYLKGRKGPGAVKIAPSGRMQPNVHVMELWTEQSSAHGMPVPAPFALVGVVEGRPVVRLVPTMQDGTSSLAVRRLSRAAEARVERQPLRPGH